MNKKGRASACICAFTLIVQQLYCMSGKDNPLINHSGAERKLSEHIFKSHFVISYPFSVTRVLKKNDNGEFYEQGDIRSLEQEDIEEYIKQHNWLYLPEYRNVKTRFSKDQEQQVGALILGTIDINDFSKIQRSALLDQK